MRKHPGLALAFFIFLIGATNVQAQDSLKIRIKEKACSLYAHNGSGNEQNYHKVLAAALIMQLKADSLSRIARDKQLLARNTPEEEISRQLVEEIIQANKEAKYFQSEADKKFSEARDLNVHESVAVISTGDSLITPVKEINGIRIYQYKGTIPEERSGKAMIMPEAEKEPAEPPKQSMVKKDEFTLGDKSLYSADNPIPRGLKQYPGLIYRIQLGVFSKIKPNDAFGGISPVTFEPADGGSMLKYYAGIFYSLNTVTGALGQIRVKGFPDAFVVAFFNGSLISTEKAREIEFAGFKL